MEAMFVMVLKLAKKFIAYVFGVVILTMLIGFGFFTLLCSAKGMCLQGALSWIALGTILAILGFAIGTYNFIKMR